MPKLTTLITRFEYLHDDLDRLVDRADMKIGRMTVRSVNLRTAGAYNAFAGYRAGRAVVNGVERVAHAAHQAAIKTSSRIHHAFHASADKVDAKSRALFTERERAEAMRHRVEKLLLEVIAEDEAAAA